MNSAPRSTRDRRAGQTIVFTNGCFDLIHAGHLQLLKFARAQGDKLVVGLNSDRSVRVLKGGARPIHPAAERATNPRGAGSRSITSSSSTIRAPKESCGWCEPDVLVKGEDYRGQIVDGQKFVESYGGSVALAPLLTRTLEHDYCNYRY